MSLNFVKFIRLEVYKVGRWKKDSSLHFIKLRASVYKISFRMTIGITLLHYSKLASFSKNSL
ncbi:MAG: hypothetical protein CO022_03635 [Flavobacteriales bacterium CG_4_9_14_0_2_um_filter_32_27]|nr:MAG: hypothetical protein CO022_03635 [Flavobacteriales bacterium CG_4_9_14_0_2_um_filter_32_27]